MGDAIARNAGVTASERHRFLAQVPAPRRRVLHFGKCACKRQLVLSLTSAGLGERRIRRLADGRQKANQAVRGPAGVPGDLLAALSDERHGDPRKVTGSSQRSRLHAAGSGRCLHSENARCNSKPLSDGLRESHRPLVCTAQTRCLAFSKAEGSGVWYG